MGSIKRVLGLTEVISIKRQTILAAIFFALVFFLMIPQPALATVTSSVDADGVLTVTSDTGDKIKIYCSDGKVWVNNYPPGGHGSPEVPCSAISWICVNGGTGKDEIDLSGVTPGSFPNIPEHVPPNLYFIMIRGNAGNDKIIGSGFGEYMSGGDGNDLLSGGDGNDWQEGGDGNDHLFGGDGDDCQIGGDGNDWQIGGDGNDVQEGGDGDDHLFGGDGNDWQIGGDGNDYQEGGTGDDVSVQEPGSADIVNDEAGIETLDFSPATSGITIDLDLQNVDQVVDAAANTVQIEGQFENFIGSEFDDVVFVDPLDVPRSIDGGGGTDTLNFDAQGLPATDDGATITTEGFTAVTYTNFETVNISNTTACLPSIEVNKMVFNETSGHWVDETTAKVNDTLRFRCVVHNSGTCCNLTNITVMDILSDSLEYRDNATVDGTAQEPTQVSGNEYKWEFAGPLAPSEAITIEFDARVIECGNDRNMQNATAWCEETGTWVYDEDTVWVNCTVPSVCVETATGTGTACFATDKGTIEDLIAVDESTLPEEGKPALVFPHGFFSFKITGLTPCAHQKVTITLPSALPVGTQYWKYHVSEGGWIQIPMGSDDGDNVITITLEDGGLGDDDGECNGVIVDSGGPGVVVFDTGSPANPYPSISGTHNGTITPNVTIKVSKLYTYPCAGTGGHSEYARIWNTTLNVTARWEGYRGDWHNISFDKTFTLAAHETYNYTIKTGSYPRIIHEQTFTNEYGAITCTEFRDTNGRVYYDWIPAIKLFQ